MALTPQQRKRRRQRKAATFGHPNRRAGQFGKPKPDTIKPVVNKKPPTQTPGYPAPTGAPTGSTSPVAKPPPTTIKNPAYVQPFLTPEQQADLDSAYFTAGDQLGTYDAGLRSGVTSAEFQKVLAAEAAKQMAGKTQNQAAARGIYFSSIKDAELFDIDKAKQRQIQYYDQTIDDLKTGRDELFQRLYGSGGLTDIAEKLAIGQKGQNAIDKNKGAQPTIVNPAALEYIKHNPATDKLAAYLAAQKAEADKKKGTVGSSGPASRTGKKPSPGATGGGSRRPSKPNRDPGKGKKWTFRNGKWVAVRK